MNKEQLDTELETHRINLINASVSFSEACKELFVAFELAIKAIKNLIDITDASEYLSVKSYPEPEYITFRCGSACLCADCFNSDNRSGCGRLKKHYSSGP